MEWKKLEEKSNDKLKEKKSFPILAKLLKDKTMELLNVPKFGVEILDIMKVEKLYNHDTLAKLVVDASSKLKKITHDMKKFFKDKDWEKNEMTRKGLTMEVLKWHRTKFEVLW